MFVVCFLVGTQNFFFVSCLPCQRGYHNVHVMDKRMRFLLLDLLIIIICSCRCKFLSFADIKMIGNLLNFLKKSNLYFLRKSVTAEFDERQYLFLKRLCQVLVTLGEVQLFHLWVRVKITFKKHPFFVILRSFLINIRFQ